MNPSVSGTKPASIFSLPRIGSPAYHILLGAVAIFILGPLGGVSAAYMNFSIGFFIGGQVLAGILGSAVTLPYGPEGKHGANYIQTMSASVAGMCGLGVLMQAMIWLGMTPPPAWQLVLFYTSIGMFGTGLGMLYTPILVDRMQLAYPSGFAVANILRALTDKTLLRKSIAKLGGGLGGGFLVGVTGLKFDVVATFLVKLANFPPLLANQAAATLTSGFQALNLSVGTVGAGMIVGARLAIPAFVVGIIGFSITPYLQSKDVGWLQPGETYRKIGFIISLGTILGAAALDIILVLIQFAKQLRSSQKQTAPAEDWKRVNSFKLVAWVIFWGIALVFVGSEVLHQPLKYLLIAVALCFVFVMVNGISQGISDWNPLSAAFVTTVFILVAFGLRSPGAGLMCAAVVLVSCNVGGDMQQDRSTGWRLGTNRVNQFRYQVLGLVVGAMLAVVLARTFMEAYPVLKQDQFSQKVVGAEQWQSAMTLKFVGAIRGITNEKPYMMTALRLGIAIGLFIEIVRKLLKNNAGYKRWSKEQKGGRVFDFCFDAVLMPSPYASSFGGFVELTAVVWWTIGGLISAGFDFVKAHVLTDPDAKANGNVPEDMGTMSLVGGGMIAGDSLAALSVGVAGLISSGALKKLLLGG